MIFEERSLEMLAIEKEKSKMKEFFVDISKKSYNLDSEDLIYTTIYVLSIFCEQEFLGNYQMLSALDKSDLVVTAKYFEYTLENSEDAFNSRVALLGAITYFSIENFGNSKVLLQKIRLNQLESNIEITIYTILSLVLLQKETEEINFENMAQEYFHLFLIIKNHIYKGEIFNEVYDLYKDIEVLSYNDTNIIEFSFVSFLKPLLTLIEEYSSWNILTRESRKTNDMWRRYIESDYGLNLLWPSQKMILENGALTNRNGIVPLPTGVGKTKSFEIIVYNKLVVENKNNIVILAPLKALCNEISFNLKSVFQDFNWNITKFTDVYQDDIKISGSKKNIIVSTPEKFNFILRHKPNIIDYIDLYILDEAHLFDDLSRGASYDLLVSNIKRLSKQESQILLFSAMLSNSEQISEWLFNENRVVKNIQEIKTSEKLIGYVDTSENIHFYNNQQQDELFSIPCDVCVLNLNKGNKKTKKWMFPNLNGQNKNIDLSLYYSNILVRNGAIAIFIKQPSSLNTILTRLVDLTTRTNIVGAVTELTSSSEAQKFANLFNLHYGENNIYSKASLLGFLPHYSALMDGIRESVEYAIRKSHFKIVISTSTLAEGVNIPIKYLLIHSLLQNYGELDKRKISNLIGRTARSGVYTEGSVILLNDSIYGNRDTYKGKEKWNKYQHAFNTTELEDCKSSILILVEAYTPDYSNTIYNPVFNAICLHRYYREDDNWRSLFLNEFLSQPTLNKVSKEKLSIHFDNICEVISTLESFIAYIYIELEQSVVNSESIKYEIVNTLKETYAYYVADKEQKKLLSLIFDIITEKTIGNLDQENKFFYSKSLFSLDITKAIWEWISEESEKMVDKEFNEFIEIILSKYFELFSVNNKLEYEDLKNVVYLWIKGENIINIQQSIPHKKSLQATEKLVSTQISYNLSFFIGTMIDCIDEEDSTLVDRLEKLQKMIKYGVSNMFSVNICEQVFTDRLVAQSISNLLGVSEIDFVNFRPLLHKYSEDISWELEKYPFYYSMKFNEYLNIN